MSYAAYNPTSSSLMHISEALALSPNATSHTLTVGERTAMRKSDRKAEQLLGVTVTRDVKTHGIQDLGIGRAPLTDLKSTRANASSIVEVAQNIGIGALMAVIGSKRARSRQFSSITLVGALKHLGVGMGLDATGRKKRRVGATYSPRVILGPLHYSYEEGESSSGSSTAGSEDEDPSPRNSFLELDPEEECARTPTMADHPYASNADDEDDYEEEEFVWDVADPFVTPENPEGHQLLQEYFSKLRLGEPIGPLDQPTSYEPTSFEPSYEDTLPASSPVRGSRRSSCDLWGSQENLDLGLLPSDLEYINTLLAVDEAEEEAMARRKHKRATLRSRLKKLALLGSEARPAVDGQVTSNQ
ncbi:hypothetical protein HYDPIDRAFT_108066 [Hydnomerulius pinastri MD-312]|nr:hypothetical protein HYDPIDRAFT_108066 [Hydnomerulius pinastri MD-312]